MTVVVSGCVMMAGQGDQGSLTLAAGWPMASPVFNQGRNHTANPGEKRLRARSEQAGIAVK